MEGIHTGCFGFSDPISFFLWKNFFFGEFNVELESEFIYRVYQKNTAKEFYILLIIY